MESAFLQKKKSIALVVNEFGSISGMLTIEDVIEKIFGAINDEYDTQNLIEEKNSAGEYIFSGRLKIDELNHKYQFNIETDIEYETLAGYIIHQLERIPNLYEEFELEPYKFKILEVTDGQILKIQLKRGRG